jgi:diadenosine tetraphosphate (Ap4A) HIT family hydrolase
MGSVVGCFACDLSSGRLEQPGGVLHRTSHWSVTHCVGPLGLGTLIVKPNRHVLHLADLREEESRELGPLPALTSSVVNAA